PAPGVADPEERCPFRTGVGRRNGHDRDARFGGGSLAEVDGATAADRHDPVARVDGNLGDVLRRDLGPASGRPNAEPEIGPAFAREEERLRDAELPERVGQLRETPANDHAGTSLAFGSFTLAGAPAHRR